MKNNIVFFLMCAFPLTVNAAIPYRVEQVDYNTSDVSGYDAEAFARQQRFYIGGGYAFTIWNNGADDTIKIKGKNTSSFDGVLGIRLYDIFRLEANYSKLNSKWNAFEMNSDLAMVNAIFDARIDNLYRLFYKQYLVPYIGLGAGISWNSVDAVTIEDKISPVVSALAGVALELGSHFALDLGYRYLYMFSPKFNVIKDFAPGGGQFRLGVRVNF